MQLLRLAVGGGEQHDVAAPLPPPPPFLQLRVAGVEGEAAHGQRRRGVGLAGGGQLLGEGVEVGHGGEVGEGDDGEGLAGGLEVVPG